MREAPESRIREVRFVQSRHMAERGLARWPATKPAQRKASVLLSVTMAYFSPSVCKVLPEAGRDGRGAVVRGWVVSPPVGRKLV